MDGQVPKQNSADVIKAEKQPFDARFVNKHNPNSTGTVEEAFWNDVRSIANSMVSKVGKNQSIDKIDLVNAFENHKLNADEEMVGAALYDNFAAVKNRSIIPGGITSKELNGFFDKSLKNASLFRRVDDLTYWADDQGNLKRFSNNHSGVMQSKDIDKALAQSKLTAEDRARLGELKANFNSIAVKGLLGKKEIDAYYDKTKHSPEVRQLRAFRDDMLYVESNQNNKAARSLFADSKDPLKSIQVDAVKQGYAGDCAFKAALAGLAGSRPEEILNMVKADGSSFKIHFPGAWDEKEIRIAPPTAVELALFSSRENNNGSWAAVLAKGFGQFYYDHANPLQKMGMQAKTISEWAGENASAIRAIEVITGNRVDSNRLPKLSDDEIAKQILQAKSEKRVMVLGTKTAANMTPDGYKHGHAFTIVDAKNSTNGDLMLTVRDPRAIGDNLPNGTSQVNLQKLRKNFDFLYIETKNKI